jgi:antitoxin ParD1/3/4
MEKLSITVTEEHAEAIRSRVESGEYGSTSEVIRAALRLLDKDEEMYQERLETIRRRIQASIDDPRPSLSGEEVRTSIDTLVAKTRRTWKPRAKR